MHLELDPRGRKNAVWSDEKMRIALELRQQGLSHREIAQKLGVSDKTVNKHLLKYRDAQNSKHRQLKAGIATSRTFINSTMHEPLNISDFVPARKGAMDYVKIKSKGV